MQRENHNSTQILTPNPVNPQTSHPKSDAYRTETPHKTRIFEYQLDTTITSSK